MNDTSPIADAEPALPQTLDYDAKSAMYDRLTEEAATRNKTAVFDALAKAGISIVTVTFDGYGDSGQIEDVQASNQDTPIALPSDQLAYEAVRWGETEPTHTSCSLRDALENLAFHYLATTHGGWEDNDGAYGEFTFETSNRSITLAYNERFTDVEYSEHTF
ncbi:MAG TPA: hypothetical protein VMU78_06560 [Methylocella sp.]|nr:hypothetical protein [Methylocella sp.]